MAKVGKPKVGGGKMSRSETVTVRLDPKLRYLAELAARRQRRTVSSYIEWAIEESLSSVLLDESNSVALAATKLWDVDEPDRFAKLAFRYPDMLTHEEQTLWKLIRESGMLWLGDYCKPDNKWTWTVEEDSMDTERLREYWDIFNAIAKGDAKKSSLPKWGAPDDDCC